MEMAPRDLSYEVAPGEAGGTNGGCVLCRKGEFQTGGFSESTVLICDLCYREFHVGCLKAWRRGCYHQLPTGDWYCSPTCASLRARLAAVVDRGVMPIGPKFPYHSWQMLQGSKMSAN